MYYEDYDCYSLAEYRNDTLNGFTITYDCNYPIEIGFITDHNANGVFFEFESRSLQFDAFFLEA